MTKNAIAWVLIGIGLMMLAHTCSGCGSADVCDLGPPDGTPAVGSEAALAETLAKAKR